MITGAPPIHSSKYNLTVLDCLSITWWDVGLVVGPEGEDMGLRLQPERKDTSRFVAVDSKLAEAHRVCWLVGRIPRSVDCFPRMAGFEYSAL